MMVAMSSATTRCRAGEPSALATHHAFPRGRRCRRWYGIVSTPVLIGRYYDPATGQFLSVDPAVEQTQQAYLYVGDDPVNASDPSGLFAANQCEAPAAVSTCDKGGRNPFALLVNAYGIVNNALNGALNQIDQGAMGFLKGNGAQQQCGSLSVGDQFACGLGVVLAAAVELGGGEEEPEIKEVLKGKLGSIQRAPLPKGAPSWDEVRSMTISDIREGAQRNLPGYKELLKLLTDRRFNK